MRWRGAVFFDLDGTLVDSQREGSLFRRWSTVFGRVSNLSRGILDPVGDLIEIVTGIGLRYPFVPGVVETLEALRREGFLLGLFTDRPALMVSRYFRTHPEVALKDFTLIRTTKSPLDRFASLPPSALHLAHNDWKNGRHLEEAIVLLRREHGVPPQRVVFVGDHVVDVRAAAEAKEAGVPVRFLASTWGKLTREELKTHGVPDSDTLSSFSELAPKLLED